MRITKLTVENINSLKGKWSIDFESNAYCQSGLFAITGPTGSGKSSLLDAICLALYGTTPRMENGGITKEEVLNKECSNCSAGIEFVVKGKRYRSTWALKYPKKRSEKSRPLNPVSLEEFDNDKREWISLANQITPKAVEVQKITCLTYQQFTRSVLLAQGGFAQFLQAKDREKSSVLEQVTGTEIYQEISTKVFERYKQEEAKVESLRTVLNDKKVLSEEEKKRLAEELASAKNKAAELEKNISDLQKICTWKSKFEDEEVKFNKASLDKEKIEETRSQIEQERVKVRRNESARQLDSVFSELTGLRDQKNSETSTKEKTEKNLQSALRERGEANIQLDAANKSFNEFKEEQSKLAELLKTVRELDTVIGLKRRELNEKDKAIVSKEKDIAKHSKNLKRIEEEKKSLETQLEQINAWLNQNSRFENLVKESEALQTCKTQYERLIEDLKALKKDKQRNNSELAETNKDLVTCSNDIKQLSDKKEEQQKVQEQNNEKIKKLLAGKTKEDLSTQEIDLIEKRNQADNIRKQCLDPFHLITQNLVNHESQLEKDRKELDGAQAKKEEKEKLIEELKEKISLLEDLRRIGDLEEQRKLLKPNTPCPLCGALDHPYAEAKPEGVMSAADKLTSSRAKLNEEEKRLTKMIGKISSLQTKIDLKVDSINADKKDLEQKISELKDKFELNGLAWTGSVEAAQTTLDQFRADIDTKISDVAEVRNQIANLEKSNDPVVEKIDSLTKQITQQQISLSGLNGKLQQLEQAKIEIDGKSERWNKEKDKLLIKAVPLIKTYSDVEISWETVLPLIKQCLEDIDKFSDRKAEKNEKENDLKLQNESYKNSKERIEEATEVLHSLKADFAECEIGFKAKEQERTDLFGNKNPDQEESLVAKKLRTAEATAKKASDLVKKIDESISGFEAVLEATTARLNFVNPQLEEKEKLWSQRLGEEGFTSFQEWSDCRLEKDEVSRLNTLIKDFDVREKANKALLEELSNALNKYRLENLTDKSSKDLDEEMQQLTTQKDDANKQIGSLTKTLQADDEAVEEVSKLQEKIAEQKDVLRKWKQLNTLIGSKDGNKYRTFVQSLTLDSLIKKANVALESLSNRYFLIKNSANPMDLDVIDGQMGSIVRSTKNLSGGETFIVSLALAIGLSDLAGNKVTIDSLFLDEGFGTLDEESLEKALGALANLNNFYEGKGRQKLIGVISHVGRIHEQIPVQIKVIPKDGGVSNLQGEGVVAL